MKKIFAMAAVLAFAVVPASADDITDGSRCSEILGPVAVSHTLIPDGDQRNEELDRGSVCVSDGNPHNGAEVYVGGELRPEEGGNAPGGWCGAIIVAGETIAGDPDWDNEERGTHCD